MEHVQPINAYVCQYCKGSFDKLENLSKHVQKIHTVCYSGKENRICPLCGTQCKKIEGYRNHLRHIHGHNEEGQLILFKSFNDFLVWKNELEKKNYCKYVMRDPPKKLPSNDKVHIYRCDSSVGSMKTKRSGVAVTEGCPAVVTAIESAKTKGVKIEHWNNHVGHSIPVEEDELDAAIGSLGTTEIVLTSDQRYEYDGQSADGNIFFITESNDGSFSETFAKEVPKKSSSLFKNSKSKVSDIFSKPTTQKFSYKKDPTKKSGSLNYSLASVACMKPSAKKDLITAAAIAATCSVENSVSTTVTNSDAQPAAPVSSVASSEIELATESIKDVIDVDISSKTDVTLATKEKETPSILSSTPISTPIINSDMINNQTFEFINEGSLSGQVVLLNCLPGQNDNQNIVLSSDQKFISIGPAINVATASPKKGKGSKKSQKNNVESQILVIPTASEKENVSSVQNTSNLSLNSIPVDTVVKSPVPSILRKALKSVQKSPKRSTISNKKNDKFAGKRKLFPSPKKAISDEEKLSLGLNPGLDVTVVDAVKIAPRPPSSSAKKFKVDDSVTVEVVKSTPNMSSININSLSGTQDTETASSSLITNDIVLSPIKNQGPSVSQNTASSSAQISASSATQSSASPAAQCSVSSAVQSSASPSAQSSVSSGGKISVTLTSQNSVSSAVQSSIPSNIQPVNPILLNSFPPGQTFMSINNNLIPIGTPTAPLLPSNFSPGFVLSSPVLPSPGARPARPLVTYSRLATRLPVSSTVGNAVRLTPPHTSTAPLLLIPNLGSQIAPSVPFSSPLVASSLNSTISSSIRPNITQPIISNSLISSSVCSVLPRPLLSNCGTPIFTQLAPGTRLVSTPIIRNISTPLLRTGKQNSRPLLQNVPRISNPRQPVPRQILQSISFPTPLIGQPAAVPVTPRAIVSTTVSNAIKVQKVQLPFSKAAVTNPSVTFAGISSATPVLSDSTKVSSVVLNTEPISSTPAISIPPLTSVGSQKPGSVIFESQGDMYMLEPVDDNPPKSNDTSTTTSVKSIPNKISVAVPSLNGNTKTNKLDEVGESALEGSKANLSSLLKETSVESQSILDTKADGRVKSLSPRKNSDIKNGVQIKSVVQEKRHLKDDDVEILKKVKYYQMEMKFLASQAECQRLKLELARAQMKNKEIIKNSTVLATGNTSLKENTEDSSDKGTSDKDNFETKETLNSDKVTENMHIDNASHEVDDKTVEDPSAHSIDNTESTNQSNPDSIDSNHGSDHDESSSSNFGDNFLVYSDDSNQSLSLKEDQADHMDNQNSNNESESMNCDVDLSEITNLDLLKEELSALNEPQNINTIENRTNDLNSCGQTTETDPNKEPKDTKKSDQQDTNYSSENQLQKLADEFMELTETEKKLQNSSDDNQAVKDSESGNRLKCKDLDDKEKSKQNNNLDDAVHLVNQSSKISEQKTLNEKDSMDFDDSNNRSPESEVNMSCGKTQFHETLQELEFQYGNKESSDIYTMIRTSVLRSLYDDMKTLCEENKKLYEKLQECRSQEESGETDELHI